MYEIEPACIALEMRDATGRVFTAYWQMDDYDRACIVNAIQDDGMLMFFRNNRDAILDILNEGDEEDGLQESDTETDSTG